MTADWIGEVRRIDTLPDTLASIVDALRGSIPADRLRTGTIDALRWRDAVTNGTGLTVWHYDDQGIHATPVDWRSTIVGIDDGKTPITLRPMMARDFHDGAA